MPIIAHCLPSILIDNNRYLATAATHVCVISRLLNVLYINSTTVDLYDIVHVLLLNTGTVVKSQHNNPFLNTHKESIQCTVKHSIKLVQFL